MKVGVPTEIKTDEYRVALTPAGVRELVDVGHPVFVQSGAGRARRSADEAYIAQGAHILPDADEVFGAGEHDRQGQGTAAVRGGATAAATTCCSPTCTSPPMPS